MAARPAAAAGAGREPQKQLLSIIRDFAAEKSHGERRVTDLKRRLDDVRAASDAAAAELEAAKRARESAEQELRGGQVQVAIAAAQFQQTVSVEFKREKCSELSSGEGQHVRDRSEIAESEGILKDLIDKVNNAVAELHVLEEEYKKDLLHHDEVRRELADTQAKRALMEAVMGETKQLQELGEYPFLLFFQNAISCANSPSVCKRLSLTGSKRAAEMERAHASLAEELQRRYACPGCGVNNMVGLEEAAAS
uniref:Uncharacterized protein n=1 Tax=Oryza punctata TaxID=4537 RepID=A0A0E0L9X0_ORYPU